MFKKSQNQSTNENGKKPFFQKVRDVAHTVFWLGGKSYNDINKDVDDSINETQEFLKKGEESQRKMYKNFCKKK